MAAEAYHDYYVYVLFRWNGEPYYVGKGRGPRAARHSKRAGHEIPTVKIAEAMSNNDALTMEKAFIRAIGRQPYGPLINKNPGGSGPSTLSEEAREKARLFHLGKQWALGYKHTPETIEIIRATSAGRRYPNRKPASEWNTKPKSEWGQSRPRTRKPRPVKAPYGSIEHRTKISKGLTGKKLSPAHRAKAIVHLGTNPKTRWITDGVTTRKIRDNDPIPAGWQRGTRPHSEASRENFRKGWEKRRAEKFVTED